MALEAVLVLVFLLLPGIVADAAYRFVTWRPDPSDQGTFVRATAISFAALFGLVALDSLIPTVFEIPVYLQPGWWRSEAGARELPWADLAPGWLQHAAVALVGSLGVGLLVKSRQLAGLLRRMLGRSLYSSAWDEFAVQNIGRWVLVTLSGGRVFYGVLGIASGDRKKDVVLYRPMPYDADKGTYQFTGNKVIFIREDEVESVLVPLNPRELAEVRGRLGVYHLSTGERIDVEKEPVAGTGDGGTATAQ
jgi:hypothetical protein